MGHGMGLGAKEMNVYDESLKVFLVLFEWKDLCI